LEFNNEIFSRERLAHYDPERLNRSTVLIVGAGALGQNTAMNLALAGVGELRIIDPDCFEEHNRTRSPAYPLPEEQERYGMDKARAVAYKLRRLMTAPQPKMSYATNWVQELGDGAFSGVSVVVACVDSQLARAYLSDKARQHGLPFIEGGLDADNLTLTSFPAVVGDEARTTPCWRCSHPDVRGSFSCRNYARNAEALGIIPAVQNAAATLGGLQAEATILALHSDTLLTRWPRAFDLNIRTLRSRTINLARDTKCSGVHRSFDTQSVMVRTAADDTVEQLLQELTERLGGTARLRLSMKTYSKLIWNAPCTKCGRMLAVRSPEWRWKMTPSCSNCGGPFGTMAGVVPTSPDTYTELTLRSNSEVLRATCRQIGLPPSSFLEAAREDSVAGLSDEEASVVLFQLPGSPQEFYKSGDAR
jgi:molybdopterin-synthase adenylyltransferase